MAYHLLLADDDTDDCIFFKEVLEELSIDAKLTTVKDGIELMHFLNQNADNLPDVLFLDLNMPRKKGSDCLCEIKSNEKLKQLPVIIYSTSFDPVIAASLYENGAHYYICKPADFTELIKTIREAIEITRKDARKPAKEKFLIQA